MISAPLGIMSNILSMSRLLSMSSEHLHLLRSIIFVLSSRTPATSRLSLCFSLGIVDDMLPSAIWGNRPEQEDSPSGCIISPTESGFLATVPVALYIKAQQSRSMPALPVMTFNKMPRLEAKL